MKKTFKKLFRFLLKLTWLFFVSTILVVVIYKFVPVFVTPLMVIRSVEQVSDPDREFEMSKKWVRLNLISEKMPLAVIAAEDQRFMDHFGIDIEAIEKAQEYNRKHKGKKVRGASTISQQTAKNVFLWPSRSWIRKGFEVYFTFLIEVVWGKKRIMEVYLNVAEMGNGVFGAEAASRKFFKKPALKLSANESAAIAACLPNPRRWRPDRPTAYISRRAAWIRKQMYQIEKPEFLGK
jgi:monofunctional biosynthetic peptidoglycan transglycosylase